MSEYPYWEIIPSVFDADNGEPAYLIVKRLTPARDRVLRKKHGRNTWRGTKAEAEKELLLILAKGEEDE